MARPPKLHNLRHNRAEASPARWLFFDTETLPEFDGPDEVHVFRLAVAELVERRGPVKRKPRPTWWSMCSAAELADCVEDACRPGESLWACAHGLAFDLTVTRLPVLLAERGWELTDHALTAPSPWCRMRRGTRRLALVDSHSWLPAAEAAIATDLGLEKRPLPAWDAPEAEWWQRCAQDVAILEAAVLTLCDWWDGQRLGHWSLTGPATGWNAYRHRMTQGPVVIDPEPGRREAERGAVYAGRAEAFRVGEQRGGPWVMLDFEHAFASVMAGVTLPRRMLHPVDGLDLDDHRILSTFTGALCRVELEVREPRYPLRTPRGIVHPVGRFWTWLAGPEIAEARDRDELRAIGSGWVYALSSHMAGFGRWCIEIIEGRDPDAPAVAARCVKAWTRSVPGKWAGRTSRVAWETDQPVPGWRVEVGRHHPGGNPGAVMDMAGRRYWLVQDEDMDDCFPAVLAWIQSVVRVRLGRLLDLVGGAAVFCNTDGVMADRRRLELPALLDAPELRPLRARVKSKHRRLRVLSPLHWESDRDRQLSGIPAGAARHPDGSYTFTDWPRLSTQLQRDDPRGYVRTLHTVTLDRVHVLRWVLENGATVPVAARGGAQEGAELLPWTMTPRPPGAAPLRPAQHPLLRPLCPPALTEAS